MAVERADVRVQAREPRIGYGLGGQAQDEVRRLDLLAGGLGEVRAELDAGADDDERAAANY